MASYNILVVDDDPDDQEFLKAAINHVIPQSEIISKLDGIEAVDFLFTSINPAPDIIFLDINMPKASGLEVTKICKQHDILKQIPIIVLSTSKNYKDISEFTKLGVAAYFQKPASYKYLIDIVETVKNNWLIKTPSYKSDRLSHFTI
jgi:CheY-like chemotaxis protein